MRKFSENRFLADMYAKDPVQANFFQDIIDAIDNVAKTAGVAMNGDLTPPPPVNAINVKASGELIHATISHAAAVNRSINYFLEADTSPSFTQPHVMDLGASRTHIFHLPSLNDSGNQQPWYLRAYAQYPGSKPSTPTVLGGLANPTPVMLLGSTKLSPLPPTGSGTASTTGQQGGAGKGRQRTATPKVIRVGKSQVSVQPPIISASPISNAARNLASTFTLTGSWTNPQNAIDNDPNTFAVASSTTANVVYLATVFAPLTSTAIANTLQVIAWVTAVSGSAVIIEYSVDSGSNWINIDLVSVAQTMPQTYQIPLPLTIAAQNVQVRITLPGSSTGGSLSVQDFAGTAANDATVGTAPWVNPTNAQGNQTTNFASVSFSASSSSIETTEYLKLTNFGFAVPVGATINGIQASVYKAGFSSSGFHQGSYYSITTSDNSVKLYKAGVLTGSDHLLGSNWPNSPSAVAYGGSTDLWGATWAPADINNAGFGIAISANLSISESFSSQLSTFSHVYYVAITVYYTTSSGSSSATTKIYDIAQLMTLQGV